MKYLLLILLLFLTGCSTPPYPHKYKAGDFVCSILDGRRGYVVATNTYYDGIWVTFSGDSLSSPLLGGDVDKSPYSTIHINEWEVQDCK